MAPPRDVVVTVERYLRPGIALVAILVLVVLGLRTIKAMQPPTQSVFAESRRTETTGSREADALGPPSEAMLLKSKVVEETQDRPEVMAQVVRAWMAEGSDR